MCFHFTVGHLSSRMKIEEKVAKYNRIEENKINWIKENKIERRE